MDTRNWADYFDSNQLPCQLNKDGGDTTQRLGMLWVAAALWGSRPLTKPFNLMEPLETSLLKLQASPGIYFRNPINYNQTNDFSRDQQTSLVIAMGFYSGKGTAIREMILDIFWQHVKRFGKYQNADWAGPDNWGQYIRALDAKWAYPLLWFTDLFMLGGVIIRVIKSHINIDDVSDDLDTVLSLLQAKQCQATLWSFVARKVYKLKVNGIQWALDWYFRASTDAPPMNELYRSIIAEHFT